MISEVNNQDKMNLGMNFNKTRKTAVINEIASAWAFVHYEFQMIRRTLQCRTLVVHLRIVVGT